MRPSMKNVKNIFITGAKGFLGSSIAKRLLTSGHKLSLLVRKRNGSNKLSIDDIILNNYLPGCEQTVTDQSLCERFFDNVEIYEGNITSEFLGLDKDVYGKLCNEIDVVFHCAAATHFEDQKANELIDINVGGTENVVLFANSGKKKRFHHISTAYVNGKHEGVSFEKALDNGLQFNNEYERSKYIAEKVVVKYAEDNAIPYTIYRPSIVIGDSVTGFTCKFDNLYLFAKVLFNIKNSHLNSRRKDILGNGENDLLSNKTTKPIIRVPGEEDAPANLVPIDYVADAIVEISKNSDSINKIFHVTNPNPPTIIELRDSLMSVLGIDGVVIEIDGQMEGKSLNTLERLFLRQTKTYYSYMFSKLSFDCSNTAKILKGTGIKCPAISYDLIKLLIDYAVSHDWGEKKPLQSQKMVVV